MFCPHCGVQNADDHNFCAACGAALRTSAPAAGAPPPGYPARPAPPPPYTSSAPPASPPYPQPPYGAIPPARRTRVLGVALFGLLMLAVGGAAAYVVVTGGLPGNLPLPLGQAAMDSWSDPQGRFKIRYPHGWAAQPLDEGTVFSQRATLGSGRRFSAAEVSSPTIIAGPAERSDKDISPDQALAETGLTGDSETQILGKRFGKVSTASGQADAVWADILHTGRVGSQRKQVRGRVISEVRRSGDGTVLKGIAACLAPPELFASFDRLCSSALDSYELGTP